MQEFRTDSAYPVISFDEAWAIVMAHVAPRPPVSAPLAELLGLVLAEEVRADEDVPAFAASTMDGYALIAADAAPQRRVVGEREAGDVAAAALQPGTATRIMTGAALPAGADAVIPVEETRERGGVVTLARNPRRGENVRASGSDLAAGDVALPQGVVIGPAEIGLLATVGRTAALVHPRARVAVAATGNELVDPGVPLRPGLVRDSNSYALAAAIQMAGGVAMRLPRIADTYDALREALAAAAAQADVIITSGGVSMGTKDLVKPVLEELGSVHFGRVAIKPGKPLTYATIARADGSLCHVFGLPGNPVSSLVTFEMVVRPVLRRLAGHTALRRPTATARLRHATRHEADRTEFQRAILQREDGTYVATVTGPQASSRLKSLAGANALLVIPQGVGDLTAGAEVAALLIDQPETESSA
ncbi:MAG: gephyrin-like molybdotransferase Glp [Chloroflexota bacterium]